ncbi:MAG: hypothetical protein K2X64_11100, partial [Rhodocyclaceae bacterium]|nr:hypothetical protein [Rhodocyclaceae bacterium]
ARVASQRGAVRREGLIWCGWRGSNPLSWFKTLATRTIIGFRKIQQVKKTKKWMTQVDDIRRLVYSALWASLTVFAGDPDRSFRRVL